jgi:hypothetical protein
MYRTYGKDSDSPPFFSVLEVIALFVVKIVPFLVLLQE